MRGFSATLTVQTNRLGPTPEILGYNSGHFFPGSNTREFISVVLAIALKALDLPFNFYDESHTNFFGSRAAWLLYDRACQSKRDDVAEFLRKITVWLYQGWRYRGRPFQLPL